MNADVRALTLAWANAVIEEASADFRIIGHCARLEEKAEQIMREQPDGYRRYIELKAIERERKADPMPSGTGDHAQILHFEWAHREVQRRDREDALKRTERM